MIASLFQFRALLPRALPGVLLLSLGAALSGCAGMSDGMTSAFADPAKYTLYDCKQLETERKDIATKMARLQGLMGKAQSGVAGPVVAEVAYRNDYIALRGQAKNADEAWVSNKCHESPPEPAKEPEKTAAAPAAPANGKSGRAPMKPGSAVY
jgi:hypothetical protein